MRQNPHNRQNTNTTCISHSISHFSATQRSCPGRCRTCHLWSAFPFLSIVNLLNSCHRPHLYYRPCSYNVTMEHIYMSADTYSIDCSNRQQNNNVLVKFLHLLNVSELPVTQLCLKVGYPVILLCNIDAKCDLCNGTCTTVIQILFHLL
jgi:hypothetical protein